MRQEFCIPGRLDGLNDIIKANRSHYHAGAKEKRRQQDIVVWAIKAGKVKPMRPPIFIRFTWVEENEKRDLDNIAAAKKFILDALVECGIFENDNRKWIVGFVDIFPEPDRSNPHIKVEMEEVCRE